MARLASVLFISLGFKAYDQSMLSDIVHSMGDESSRVPLDLFVLQSIICQF
jgi:hypothetical protein